MNKGVVMQLKSRHIIVMTPEGRFKKIPRHSQACSVGEEIELPSGHHFSFPLPRSKYAWTAAAVVLIMIFSLIGIFGGGQPAAAYVTVDINPSVELGINAKRQVVEARGLNEDGQTLLKGMDYKGKPLQEVTKELIQEAKKNQFLPKDEADIVITSTVVNTGSQLDENALADLVKQQINDTIQADPADAPKK